MQEVSDQHLYGRPRIGCLPSSNNETMASSAQAPLLVTFRDTASCVHGAKSSLQFAHLRASLATKHVQSQCLHMSTFRVFLQSYAAFLVTSKALSFRPWAVIFRQTEAHKVYVPRRWPCINNFLFSHSAERMEGGPSDIPGKHSHPSIPQIFCLIYTDQEALCCAGEIPTMDGCTRRTHYLCTGHPPTSLGRHLATTSPCRKG